MAKVSPNTIPNLEADWGRDERNNLPYSGEAVQEFLKSYLRTFAEKTQLYYYSDVEWAELTNDDTDYSNVPDGTIFIYEDESAPTTPPPSYATFDSTTGALTFASDTTFDTTTGTLTLGSSSTFDASTGTLTL